jgi:phenylacetate-CoA ligase
MHLFEDLVITEVVGADNQPVPPGEYGAKVLVTVLFSRTVPLIRYEMSDSLQLGGNHYCPCGRPYAVITGIQGREQESLTFPTGDGQVRAVQPIVFHHIMDGVHAAGWQIQQTGAGLEVLLAQPHEVDRSMLAGDIRSALAAQGVLPPPVHINQVEAIPRTALGKAPLITKTSS